MINKDTIVLLNKSDIQDKQNHKFDADMVLASVKENKNIDSLIKKIKEKLSKKFTSNNTALITRERHRVKLNDCLKEINKFLKKDQSKDLELAAEDLRMATRHLAYCFYFMCKKSSIYAHSSGCCCCLASSVSTPYNYYIIALFCHRMNVTRYIKNTRGIFYLPIQKSLNIDPRISSTSTLPTILPRCLVAILKSSAASSKSLFWSFLRKLSISFKH